MKSISTRSSLANQAPAGAMPAWNAAADLGRQQMAVATEGACAMLKYWQQLAAATLEMQTEMVGCASHLLDSEALLESASIIDTMESAIPGLESFFAATKGALLKGNGAALAT